MTKQEVLGLAEAKFIELFQDLVQRFDDRYPGRVFYLRDGELVLEYTNTNLFCDHRKIWKVISVYFDNYNDTQFFIQTMVSKHLNWEGVTPVHINSCSFSWIKSENKYVKEAEHKR